MDRETTKKIAQTARRSAGNESQLLFWAITICVFLYLYFYYLPMRGFIIPVNDAAFSIFVGVSVGAIIAFPYLKIMKKKIAEANTENNETMKAIKATQEAEKQEKIAKMKANENRNAK